MRVWRWSLVLGFWGGVLSPAHAAPTGAIVTVHCDPQNAPVTYWGHLQQVVSEADEQGVLLTILFARHWAAYAGASPGRIAEVADWVTTGHQIGFHHHDVSHNESGEACAVDQTTWDAQVWLPTEKLYGVSHADGCVPYAFPTIGIERIYELETKLQTELSDASYTIELAGHGTAEGFRAAEWQAGMLTSQARATAGSDNEASTPVHNGSLAQASCEDHDGGTDTVPQMGSNPYETTASSTPTLADVTADLALSPAAGDYVSVTFHPSEYVVGGLIDDLLLAVGTSSAPSVTIAQALDDEYTAGRIACP